ncbi:MAG: c-type cytochrome [Betaproteobacteria bacterium]|jgi:cytochrome c553
MTSRPIQLLLAGAALHLMAPAFGAEDVEIARLASQVCASCHGPHGDSISPAFPRLAGQNAAYIEAQLKSFKDQTRGDAYAQAYMWGMVAQLDEDTMKRLAVYYAAEKPNPGRPGDPANMAQGQHIFDSGIAASGIPPCASCHGANAQGKDAIPRLAGQHPEYLVKQLVAFKSLQRGNAPVMHVVTDKMTLEQMRAIADYAASK